MAITTRIGFDGDALDESGWANQARFLGSEYAVATQSDCLVTAVAGARQVSVASGWLHGQGVTARNEGAVTVSLPLPAAGQWHLIVARIDWNANTVTFVSIPSSTTANAAYYLPPETFPAARNTNIGVLYDVPLAWAHVRSTATSVILIDARLLPRSLRGPIRVRTRAELLALTAVAEGEEAYVSSITTDPEGAGHYAFSAQFGWKRTRPFRRVTGVAVLPASTAATNKTVAVAFPAGAGFTYPPRVVLGLVANSAGTVLSPAAENVTTTGFTLRVITNASAFGSSQSFDYIAEQATPAGPDTPAQTG